MKHCPACNLILPVQAFAPNSTAHNGLQSHCRVCQKLRQRRNRITYGAAAFLVKFAKQRATRRGIAFGLTATDVSIPEKCPVLGITLKPGEKHLCDTSPTLDRIDNARGYVPDNVIVVSYKANRMKSNATVDELEKVAAFYRALEPTAA